MVYTNVLVHVTIFTLTGTFGMTRRWYYIQKKGKKIQQRMNTLLQCCQHFLGSINNKPWCDIENMLKFFLTPLLTFRPHEKPVSYCTSKRRQRAYSKIVQCVLPNLTPPSADQTPVQTIICLWWPYGGVWDRLWYYLREVRERTTGLERVIDSWRGRESGGALRKTVCGRQRPSQDSQGHTGR